MPSKQSPTQRQNRRASARRWAAKARQDPAKRKTLLARTAAWRTKNKQAVADGNARRTMLVRLDRDRQRAKGKELDGISDPSGIRSTVVTASELRTPRFTFELRGTRVRETLRTEGPTDPIAAEPHRPTRSTIDRILDENDELYQSLIDEQQS
jgi:hypothetical protein